MSNQRLGGDKSLNVAAGDDGDAEKIDFLIDGRQNIEGSYALKEEHNLRKKILMDSLSSLNEREQYIVKTRMLTEEPETLENIGAKLGVSRERVRQIEKKAFEHLSAAVKENTRKLALEAA